MKKIEDIKEKKVIEDGVFDEERALYDSDNIRVVKTKFTGPADGESALKESSNLELDNCYFNLRYPLWHVTNCEMTSSEMTDKCRAPVWYTKNIKITNSKLFGPKGFRECDVIDLNSCEIESDEFGWHSKNFIFNDCKINGFYCLFGSSKINMINSELNGKYSFQYTKDAYIKNVNFDTKDAFWHAKNVTIEDCVISGEYLAWYSENLKLINCTIKGTQPLCYCKNLELINCKMIDCDLAFENSSVNATIIGNVRSIKNPLSGLITVDSVDEVIMDDKKYNCSGKVEIRK